MKFKFLRELRYGRFLAIFFSAVFPLIVFAAGLVPCGGQGQKPCTISCFYVLLDNIMRFLLYDISLPLAATAFMVAGIMLVLGGSENAIKRGKAILTSTVIGLLIAFGAWLMIDMILRGLLKTDFYAVWNKFPSGQCVANPASPSPSTQTTSDGLTVNNPDTSTAVFNIDEGGYEDGIQTNTPDFEVYKAENDADVAAGKEGFGLTQPTTPSSSVYNSAIDNYVTAGTNLNGVDPNRVKAIIQAESSGNSKATTIDADGKSSYGLMQVRADTARLYDPSGTKGLTDAQIGDKLLNDPKYNINIGTKYYTDLSKKYGDPTLASAAYNGGPVANKPSVDCPGSLRWQCQYDNPAHTVKNTGYEPTRRYVNNINTVYVALAKTH